MKTADEKTKEITARMLGIMETWGAISEQIDEILKEIMEDPDLGSLRDAEDDSVGDTFAKFVCGQMLGMRALGKDVPLDFMQHLVDSFDEGLLMYQRASALGKRMRERFKEEIEKTEKWPDEITDKDQ